MDLLSRDGFVDDQLRELQALLPASRNVAIVLGAVVRAPDQRPKRLWNAGVVLAGGAQVAVRPKTLLPTYDVFDEKRYFARGEPREGVRIPGLEPTLGIAVCEDTWVEQIEY